MDDDVPTCPLCLEDLDATDRAMQPCKCSYVVCCWCLNHIREQLNGLCPACRTPYEEQNFTFKEVSAEAALKEAKERATAKKERERRERLKELERERARAVAVSQQKAKTNLKHARFVQRNLVYVIGLSLTLAREEYLRKPDMFGRFGRILRILVNRSHPYNADAPGGPSIAAYVQFSRDIDASSAVRSMNNAVFDGREIRCAIACTKYCDTFVKNGAHCGNADCMHVHDVADPEDVLTREDVLARQLGPPPPSHLFLPVRRRDPNAARHGQAAGAGGRSTEAPASASASASVSPQQLSASSAPGGPAGGAVAALRGSSGQGVAPASLSSYDGDDSLNHTRAKSLGGGLTSGSVQAGHLQSTTLLSTSPGHGNGSRPMRVSRSPSLSPQDLRYATNGDVRSPVSADDVASVGSAAGKAGSLRVPASELPFSGGWGSIRPAREDNSSDSRMRADTESSLSVLTNEDLRQNRPRLAVPVSASLSSSSSGQGSVAQFPPPPGFGDGPLNRSYSAAVPPPGFGALRTPTVGGGVVGESRHNSMKPLGAMSVPPGFESPDSNLSSSSAPRPPEGSGRSIQDWPWGQESTDPSSNPLQDATSTVRDHPESDPNEGNRLDGSGLSLAPGKTRSVSPEVGIGSSRMPAADAVFSGRGIVLPSVPLEASYLQGLPRVTSGVLEPTADYMGAESSMPLGLGPLISASGQLPPELRPSKRSNSRFGFARCEPQPVSATEGEDSLANGESTRVPSNVPGSVSTVVVGGLDTKLPSVAGRMPDRASSCSKGANGGFGKTSRSRFDFAEKELSPIREEGGISGPSVIPAFSLNAGDVSSSGLVEESKGAAKSLDVAFSQLSTQEKLASLFRSAQWSTQGLPPMPSIGGRSVSDSSAARLESSGPLHPPRLPNQQPSGSSHGTSPNHGNSPLVPPGFREATLESTSSTAECALASVNPGVATKVSVDGHVTDLEKDKVAGRDRLLSPGNSAQDQGSIKKASRQEDLEVETMQSGCEPGRMNAGNFEDICGTTRIKSAIPALHIAPSRGMVGADNTSRGGVLSNGMVRSATMDPSGQDSWDIVISRRPYGASAVDTDLAVSELELERQVQAARAREAQLAAQLSELQQQIRRFDNIRT